MGFRRVSKIVMKPFAHGLECRGGEENTYRKCHIHSYIFWLFQLYPQYLNCLERFSSRFKVLFINEPRAEMVQLGYQSNGPCFVT